MAQPRQPERITNASNRGEDGFLLLYVVVLAAIVLILLSVAAPVIAKSLRRDKEVESEHRAEQYVRAIQLYQRACKCTAYPASMDALEKSTTVRFLRKRYVDPLTGKSDWRIIHNPKTTIKGFFGQELAGLTAGLGSAAGLASGNGTGASTGTSISSGCSAANSAFCNQPVTTSTSGGAFGSSGSTGSTGSSFGDGDGGVIYGVGTSKTGDSILTPNGQTTYETWEFWYDPRIELLKANVNILGGGGPAGASSSGGSMGSTDASSFGPGLAPSNNSSSPLGSSTPNSGFGSPSSSSPGSNPFP